MLPLRRAFRATTKTPSGTERTSIVGEIIKGWRRKTGLFLLVLAMPLAMGWVRSFNIHDGVCLSLGIRCDQIESLNGSLSWMRTNRPTSNASFFPFSNGITDRDRVDLWSEIDSEIDFDRRGKWMGFEFGATTYHEPWSPSYFEFWIIPYWSLVLPPTLLAAYLLFAKAWPAKPPVSNPDATKTGG